MTTARTRTMTMTVSDLNREGWLMEIGRRMEPIFKGFTIQPYRVTCGWPCKNALSRKTLRLGECHSYKSSRKGYHEIFISPLLHSSIEVAGTLCHEMAHVVAGIEAAHGRHFQLVCRHVGLTRGKPTVVGPGEILENRLRKIIEAVGDYPHDGMILGEKEAKPRKPPPVVLVCTECECVVRMTQDWYERAGAPTCGCSGQMEVK